MTGRCGGCGELAGPGVYLCRPCVSLAARGLVELPRRWVALGTCLGAMRGAEDVRISGSSSRPLPVRAEVVELRGVIWAWLADEAHMWRDEFAIVGSPRADDVVGLADWMRPHVSRIAGREWAATTLAALRKLTGAARALTDLPATRAQFALGPCPTRPGAPLSGPDASCVGWVWVRIPSDAATPAEAVCNSCGQLWPPASWHELGRAMGRGVVTGR